MSKAPGPTPPDPPHIQAMDPAGQCDPGPAPDLRQAFDLAKTRALQKIGFFKHAALFGVASLFFLFIDLVGSPDHLWFFWLALAWLMVLFSHGARVYFFDLNRESDPKKSKEDGF